jgi:integrase
MGVKVVRKSGRKDWYIQVCVGGRRYLRHVGSREAAYASKKEIEEALATGAFVPPKAKDAAKGTTFEDAIDRWKKEHVNVNLKPRSKRYYGLMIDNWLLPVFGDMEVAAITRSDVKAAVARWKDLRENPPEVTAEPNPGKPKKRKLTPGKGLRSIPNALRALRSFFSWMIEEGVATENPASNPCKLFKVDTPFRGLFLRPEEVPLYLEGVRKKAPRYYPLIRTLTFTGVRIGEALALEWGDIDWNGRFLTVQRSRWGEHVTSPKTARSIRPVPLSPEMIEVLRAHKAAMAAACLKAGWERMPETVFVNEVGKPMDISKIRRAHILGLKEAGLRTVRIHDLRGTYTALMVSAGVPVYHVSAALGHTSTETTLRHYANLVPGAAKEMPNVLERYVFGNQAAPNANQMRTEGASAQLAVSVKPVTA